MFSQFYDTLKAKNPNALYLLYIVIELKIIHNNDQKTFQSISFFMLYGIFYKRAFLFQQNS